MEHLHSDRRTSHTDHSGPPDYRATLVMRGELTLKRLITYDTHIVGSHCSLYSMDDATSLLASGHWGATKRVVPPQPSVLSDKYL